MASPITLRVLTPEGLALQEDVLSVIAPGELGYLGILRNHAPLITTLVPGRLLYCTAQMCQTATRIGGGLLEVLHNQVTVLTDRVSGVEQVPLRQAGVTSA
jgi:F-type H+-transporting ATPase subunit epsilon